MLCKINNKVNFNALKRKKQSCEKILATVMTFQQKLKTNMTNN